MKRKSMAWAIALTLGTVVTISQAVTVMNEDFELYFEGDSLGVAPGWTGDVTNQTAYVTNSGSSLVGEFTGTDWGVIGLSIPGYPIPDGVESKILSDYTIEFDVEKTEGTGTSPEVEVSVPGLGLVRMNYPDPAVGGGQTHVSLNLANNIYIDSGFTLYGQSTVDLVLKQFGGAETVRQTYQVDNVVLSVDPSPFVKLETLPTGTFIDTGATLSATYEDNALEIDTMTLYIDGTSVVSSNSYAGGSETNTISYVASGLSMGIHTGKVVVASGTTEVTNQWFFTLIADDPTIVVGSENFEAYETGVWDAGSNPEPNPSFHDGGTDATIIDEGGTNQALLVNGNLSNYWAAGVVFDLDMSGLNVSADRDDYALEFTVSATNIYEDWASIGFEVWVFNESGVEGSIFNLGAVNAAGLSALRSHESYHFSFPLGIVDDTPWNREVPMDPSLDTWRLTFAANNTQSTNDRPVSFTVDDIVVSYTKPPFINPTVAPIGTTTNDPVMTASVNDGSSEVDTMMLYLDDIVVASNSVAGGSTTNMISYAAVGASGGLHHAKVVYWDTGTNIATNVWSFVVPATPLPPSTTAQALWNVNMAGCVNNGLRTVTNGLVLVAPTTGGSNLWNNAYGAGAPWDSPNMATVMAADETNYETVGIEFENSNWNDGPQSWAGYFSEFTALSNTIWGATQGDNDSGIVRFTGVDTNETYDVYIYWTWNRNDDAKTFNVIEGICNLPTLTMDPDRAALIANPTNYVEGQNYIVFTSIEPDENGNIAIQSSYSCAFQLVMRGEGGGPVGPTIDPTIKSFSVSGDMIHLYWDSENDVTYSVKSKSNLRGGAWVTVTNVPGAGATTSTTVPLSGDTEFFMIEGN
ncbi:MAG: hypothetical protein JXR25_16035 [Pontiellaceae bacterium]|nr:hypothetical protein [Pontiellaceae bacterium]MBN2786330.1 hypothetical protein [Pontiellaceae bacterium]